MMETDALQPMHPPIGRRRATQSPAVVKPIKRFERAKII